MAEPAVDGAPSEHPIGAAIGHEHADVTGGWLRPAVFGVMDGLVSNFALIAGVAGAGAAPRTVALTGLAGLVAGAFSMATGEYVSVASQGESQQAELDLERQELLRNPEGERTELAQVYIDRGVDPELAHEVARQMSLDPMEALRVHAMEELGVDPTELPSPWTAAGSSFAAFLVGAFLPLLPYLLGASNLTIAAIIAMIALFGTGVVTSRFTNRTWLFSGSRQLVLGMVAAVVTFAVGMAFGVVGP
ncbi:MAG: VIT1/CCC1 transporter family protein [Geodermatophilaceae bacterium]|nr:VIT1/CCC1 transporter family protein [Geodermatophilaceae bacterium]